jgi:flagellar motor switch protein FliM
MASDQPLSQEEIDRVFKNLRQSAPEDESSRLAQPYDFRRPDRIAKDQLRAIRLLHESFVRNLASSLSGYLRAYVVVDLVSVEQLSFLEFTQCLHSPTCMITLGMKPSGGNAVLEMTPSLVFPIIEILLGGKGRQASKVEREISEVEQSILEALYRIVLHDLQNAWQQVTPLAFAIEGQETQPQLLQILSPGEAVVAIGIELRMGEISGMMNIAIPSIAVKMLRKSFDQQWSRRKTEATDHDQAQILRLIANGTVDVEARMVGPTVKMATLMDIEEGSILAFDYPIDRPIDIALNAKTKFQGHVIGKGRKRALEISAA